MKMLPRLNSALPIVNQNGHPVSSFHLWWQLLCERIEGLPSGGSFSSGGVLPLVDGSIPPVFLQNPDGSLIYGEIS